MVTAQQINTNLVTLYSITVLVAKSLRPASWTEIKVSYGHVALGGTIGEAITLSFNPVDDYVNENNFCSNF